VVSVEMHPFSQRVVWGLEAILLVDLGLILQVQTPDEVWIVLFTGTFNNKIKLQHIS
jgi:hypothetical protein